MQAVLGEEVEADADELPISLSVAFERLGKIKTFHFFLLGMASLGFALFSVPLFLNLIFEHRFGLGGFERGLATSATIVPGLIAVAFVGKRSDTLFRSSPPRCLVFIGALIASFGIFIAVGVFMPNLALLLILVGIGDAMAPSAFAIVIAPISSIIPYRLRSRGVAMIGLYIFLFGAFFGSVITGLLADEIGRRGAVAVVVVPAALLGGALIAYGARYVRQDMALVVEELEEERDEQSRLREHGADSPVIQVRNLDFSYGKVQVLFDVVARRVQGRDARAARHQRRGEVDAAAGRERARRAAARGRPVQRAHGHLRRRRASGEDRHRPAHGRHRDLPAAQRRGEPPDGRVPLLRQGPRRSASTGSAGSSRWCGSG